MSASVYVGLDIGTTSIKVAAVTKQLETIFERHYAYDYQTPHNGWAEIEPDTWIKITVNGLKELFQQIPAETVKGIGITGQMHTTVFVDKHGFSVRPAIMWNDNRTKKTLPAIKQVLKSHPESAHIAKIVSTGSPLASLLWVKENEPQQFQRINKFLIAKDYVKLRLTGTYTTDYCDASTSSLYDLHTNQWSKEVQELFELDKELFPAIHPASAVIGELTNEICERLMIAKTIPVISGTGDNVASAIVSGSFENLQPLISLGTSGVVAIPNRKQQLKSKGKNVAARITEEDNAIITQGTVQAGAKINSWWLEKILKTEDYGGEQQEIPQDLLGENEVFFFPHMNGEKTLFADPELRGAFLGLGLETGRPEMYLAVLEGLAFGIRQLFEAMKNEEQPEYFTIVGGGAKSELWIRIFANSLGYPIKRVLTSQEAVHGAAILAIIGVEGSFTFPENEAQLIQPDPVLIEKYNQQYKKYLKLPQLLMRFGGDDK
ncbi:xylulokinase [Candidatus Enterococcus murrayae]|uniref:Xylulose kinase n=1 Tax=Candidatus Enterococcus murrayae TaxID=2815321 RepID=A0ABS3HCT2_9ENTE|nr:FGGY family carbohydrate kinase [Enterococcus sp. MJM16]MBO0451257.1 xylulose kinase [Enterococcus sp. MJM16]